MESLTSRILRYQQTGAEREAIVRDVARRVYEYPRRKCRWDEEVSSEFFARVFPKIQGMIERFKDVGRPFESYLASMLLFQVRTFAHERRKRELEWEVSADPMICGMELAESDGSSGASPPPSSVCRPWEDLDPAVREIFEVEADGIIRLLPAKRRFLVACLKSAHLLSDGDVAAIARIAGRDEAALHAGVQKLRARSLDRSARLARFTERRNRAFSELRLTDARIVREIDPQRRRELEERRSRYMATLRSSQDMIARIRLAPSHRQIADVLGIPKASVDSTIHRLKRRAVAFYAPRHEEYA